MGLVRRHTGRHTVLCPFTYRSCRYWLACGAKWRDRKSFRVGRLSDSCHRVCSFYSRRALHAGDRWWYRSSCSITDWWSGCDWSCLGCGKFLASPLGGGARQLDGDFPQFPETSAVAVGHCIHCWPTGFFHNCFLFASQLIRTRLFARP